MEPISNTTMSDEFHLAGHCPNSYSDGRNAFILAAKKNPHVTQIDSIPISAKGPGKSDLTIDIAIMGDLSTAQNIVFHFSATHGVEGGPGSGIQHELLTNPLHLPENSAIIFVHGLNPFGMAWNRRTNEDNIDLNRNLTDVRNSPELYAIIDPVMNPKDPIPFSLDAFCKLCSDHGVSNIRNALVGGQYDYPEGLFYGGREIAEGPKLLCGWCRKQFSDLKRDPSNLKFVIIDVHTGLGPYAVDTLLTTKPPTDKMMHIFGEKMSIAMQMSSVGYKASGVFVDHLVEQLHKITKCSLDQFAVIAQEFGTRKENEVVEALYEENRLYHEAKHEMREYDPQGPGGQLMLRAFFPEERDWRHRIVVQGRDLVTNAFKLFV